MALFDLIHKFKFTLYQLSLLLYYRSLLSDSDSTRRSLHCRSAWPLSEFFMHTHRTYLLQVILLQICSFICLLHLCPRLNRLRLHSIHYKLHCEVIGNVLLIYKIISMCNLTWSLLISYYKPLIKSSMFAQFKHFFFCSSGVVGLIITRGRGWVLFPDLII